MICKVKMGKFVEKNDDAVIYDNAEIYKDYPYIIISKNDEKIYINAINIYYMHKNDNVLRIETKDTTMYFESDNVEPFFEIIKDDIEYTHIYDATRVRLYGPGMFYVEYWEKENNKQVRKVIRIGDDIWEEFLNEIEKMYDGC